LPTLLIALPLSTFSKGVVLWNFVQLIGREEQLDGGGRVLGDAAANLVRIDLVYQQVIDVILRLRAVWKNTI